MKKKANDDYDIITRDVNCHVLDWKHCWRWQWRWCAMYVLRNDTVSEWVCVTLLLAVIATEFNFMVKVFTHDCRLLNSKLFLFFQFSRNWCTPITHSAALFSTDAIEHKAKKNLIIDQNTRKIKHSTENGQSLVYNVHRIH